MACAQKDGDRWMEGPIEGTREPRDRDPLHVRDLNEVDLGSLYRHAKGLVDTIERLKRRKDMTKP